MFSIIYRSFSKEALQPLQDFGHKMALAHLEHLVLLGTANSIQKGLKLQGCDAFMKHTD